MYPKRLQSVQSYTKKRSASQNLTWKPSNALRRSLLLFAHLREASLETQTTSLEPPGQYGRMAEPRRLQCIESIWCRAKRRAVTLETIVMRKLVGRTGSLVLLQLIEWNSGSGRFAAYLFERGTQNSVESCSHNQEAPTLSKHSDRKCKKTTRMTTSQHHLRMLRGYCNSYDSSVNWSCVLPIG